MLEEEEVELNDAEEDGAIEVERPGFFSRVFGGSGGADRAVEIEVAYEDMRARVADKQESLDEQAGLLVTLHADMRELQLKHQVVVEAAGANEALLEAAQKQNHALRGQLDAAEKGRATASETLRAERMAAGELSKKLGELERRHRKRAKELLLVRERVKVAEGELASAQAKSQLEAERVGQLEVERLRVSLLEERKRSQARTRELEKVQRSVTGLKREQEARETRLAELDGVTAEREKELETARGASAGARRLQVAQREQLREARRLVAWLGAGNGHFFEDAYGEETQLAWRAWLARGLEGAEQATADGVAMVTQLVSLLAGRVALTLRGDLGADGAELRFEPLPEEQGEPSLNWLPDLLVVALEDRSGRTFKVRRPVVEDAGKQCVLLEPE